MSNSSATVAERAIFSPYGSAALTDSGGGSIATSAIGNAYFRHGSIRSVENDIDHNRARENAAQLGRYLSRNVDLGGITSGAIGIRPVIVRPTPDGPGGGGGGCQMSQSAMTSHVARAVNTQFYTLANDSPHTSAEPFGVAPSDWGRGSKSAGSDLTGPEDPCCRRYTYQQRFCAEPVWWSSFQYAVPESCWCIDECGNQLSGVKYCDWRHDFGSTVCRWDTWVGYTSLCKDHPCPDRQLLSMGNPETVTLGPLSTRIDSTCTPCDCSNKKESPRIAKGMSGFWRSAQH